jgi:hypothetical protein
MDGASAESPKMSLARSGFVTAPCDRAMRRFAKVIPWPDR